MIKKYQGRFNEAPYQLDVFMEEVNPYHLHASLFTVHFLVRRLITGMLLVLMVQYPFFQCVFLLLGSTANIIYLATWQPLVSKKENRMELFNEISILSCCHLFMIFIQDRGSAKFLGYVGWTFMGVASLNILGNLSVVVLASVFDCGGKYRTRKLEKKKIAAIDRRRTNRQLIVKEVPNMFEAYELELNV